MKAFSLLLTLILLCTPQPRRSSDLSAFDTLERRRQEAVHDPCNMDRGATSIRPRRTCNPVSGTLVDEIDQNGAQSGNPAGLPTGDATPYLSSSRIPDVRVYDQDGKLRSFYSDLIKGNTVAIDFIFTTCTTICPQLTATFRRVQQNLSEGGLRVQLISISVDPATDTPERLRAFAAKFRAGLGWTFVTGGKSEIDSLLQALGAGVGDRNSHTSIILIGSDVTGKWTRTSGFSSPAAIVRAIQEVASRK